MNSQDLYLPSYSFYRRNCHDTSHNYLVYLSSTSEVTLLKFSSNHSSFEEKKVPIPQEPVKALRIIVKENQSYYLAIAFISKFIVIQNGKIDFDSNLKLDCNLTSFAKGFIGVEKDENGNFIFTTTVGEIFSYNCFRKEKTVIHNSVQIIQPITSFSFLSPNLYLATQKGEIIGTVIDMPNKICKQFKRCNTNSGMPILQIRKCLKQQEMYFATCHGEIHIYSKNLDKCSIVSAHYSLIVRMMVNEDKLFTFGEDGILHVFQILGNRKLKVIESRTFNKLVSLIFSLGFRNYITFYENSKIISI